MTKSDAKRLALGALIVGAFVAGSVVVAKRRKAKAVGAKKALKLEAKLHKGGVHRAASRARIAVPKKQVLA
jgi:hypothetical protein